MSQEYFSERAASKARASSPNHESEVSHPFERPNYMTVGTGSTSESAAKLAELLDKDSGYGSSIAGGMGEGLPRMLQEDFPSPMTNPSDLGLDARSDSERRTMASHIHQLYYNHNRTTLGRAITRTVEKMKSLQEVNREWPAHYPSAQPPPPPPPGPPSGRQRPSLSHSYTHHTPSDTRISKLRPQQLQRAETSHGDDFSQSLDASSSAASSEANNKAASEPRLVTPQLARDFSVLKIDLKMDGLPQTEIIHSLRKDSKALAQLLDGQINKSIRHLSALRERIEDTSSKVLITGDLNAGKSTFCNALLRRKILPEDEQPCTSIFCEVLDVRENAGVEEVHAVPKGIEYDRNNESTYEVFALDHLEHIVIDNDHWSQCKVYVKDVRSVDESLLNNGVLDIALIDAPGLNNDSLKTTAVFARQEEIDVVVFVVSAANHFTLSAREFIYDAAREKAYMFMVVNGFDMIKNKQRCQEQILKQVAHLSPATFKESSELVHFVSSNAVSVAASGASGAASGGAGPHAGFPSSDAGDNPDDDNDDNDNSEPLGKHGDQGDSADKGKGKKTEQRRDFADLEASLRRFVLEKRARSKLAPAQTYLLNVLDDLNSLATFNKDMAQSELDRVTREIQELEPVLEQSKSARNSASEELDQSTEDAATDVYSHTRETLNDTISDVSQRDLGVEYPGFLEAYQYADDITAAMLREISDAVGFCEDYARAKTTTGVNNIKSLGLLHLGDEYVDLNFHADRMLRRKKDALARQVEIDVDIWDFFDFVNLWERQDKVSNTSMAVTVAGVLGSGVIGGISWVDSALSAARVVGPKNLGRLFIPGLIAAVVIGVSYAVTSIPTSLPRRLSNKLAAQLTAIDFTHANALRVSSEVRKALKIPADNLRVGLQRNLEQLQSKKEETSKIRMESEVARKYFGNLVRDSNDIRHSVRNVDLEGPPPGAIGN